MKQKIVMKIQMHCDKCRNKALKTAAEVAGVTSVSLDGDDKDRVVVIGDNVNTICLANQIKKKFRCVTILAVEEVKKKEEKKEEKKDDKKEEPKCCAVLCLPPPPSCEPCTNCHGKCETCSKCESSKCKCKCNTCSKCHNSKCNGHCIVICFKCKNPKCDGQCIICFKCKNPKCDGQCIICFKCRSPKCHGQCTPPPPCFSQCPPWSAYTGYPPCTYQVVYESNPDSCSIM